MNWISIEDRLPEYDGDVIVSDGDMIGILSFYTPGEFLNIDSDGEDIVLPKNVTHWMPLPTLPEDNK